MKIQDLKDGLLVERINGSTLLHKIGQKGRVINWKDDNSVRVVWQYDNKSNRIQSREAWVNVSMIRPTTL